MCGKMEIFNHMKKLDIQFFICYGAMGLWGYGAMGLWGYNSFNLSYDNAIISSFIAYVILFVLIFDSIVRVVCI
jgi:hypothetical protein